MQHTLFIALRTTVAFRYGGW